MITIHELKTDPEYREMTKSNLADVINFDMCKEDYLELSGWLSADKAESLMEWFKHNPIVKAKKITVKTAVLESFEEFLPVFRLLSLIADVRQKTGRPYLTDGTITRRLRELRSEGKINFKVIDNHKSIYEKLQVFKMEIQ